MIKTEKLPGLGVIVVAGGSGSRFGGSNKLLAKIAGIPVFIYSLRNFHSLCPPGNLVLVVKESETAKFADALRKFLPQVSVKIVSGGKTRMHSVVNGLSSLPETAKFAAVHDAARPMSTAELLFLSYGAAKKHGGAVTAKRLTDTVKRTDDKCFAVETLDRDNLWRVETPQVFPVDELKAAYGKAFAEKLFLTDDSAVMENAGYRPFLLEYKLPNVKITYPEDLEIAEMHFSKSKTGQTTDVSGKNIGEIVAADYRTARVFEKYGIDFCCGGGVALAATCSGKGIDLAVITGELDAVKSEPVERSRDYSSWELPFLVDCIINTHHSYIKENTGQIAACAHKIVAVHGVHHPELIRIAAIFDKIATDMAAHLREEEEIFFPAVKRAYANRETGSAADGKDIETIRTFLKKLVHEHEEIGDAVHTIRHLAKEYAIPDDACNTFVLTYRKLREFEDDLHKHVHLENNILFPKVEQCCGDMGS
ncbi:MAG: iron-sulfur cluster repair di-iron protein [Victivallales bacterium]